VPSGRVPPSPPQNSGFRSKFKEPAPADDD
jgi:hypothetical protein